jgi:hypothetical protein
MAYFWLVDAKFRRLCDAMYDDQAIKVSHGALPSVKGLSDFWLADAKYVARPVDKTACTSYALILKIWIVF